MMWWGCCSGTEVEQISSSPVNERARRQFLLIHSSVACTPPFVANPRLATDFTRILTSALATSTSTQYARHEVHYFQFCEAHNTVPLPVTEEILLGFVTHQFTLEKSFSTVSMALCAVRNLARSCGHPISPFEGPRLELLKRGYRRLVTTPVKRPPRVPITIWVLKAMHARVSSPEDRQLLRLCTVAVWGLFRGGEVAYKGANSVILTRGSVSWQKPLEPTITLKESKTDIERAGATVMLFSVDSVICPVKALTEAWNTTASGRRCPRDPLFQNTDGSPISYSQVSAFLKRVLSDMDSKSQSISLHSFRIGGATSLALIGFPAHVIKTMGRWTSLCYQRYTQSTASSLRVTFETLAIAANSNTLLFGGLSVEAAAELTRTSLAELPVIELGYRGR